MDLKKCFLIVLATVMVTFFMPTGVVMAAIHQEWDEGTKTLTLSVSGTGETEVTRNDVAQYRDDVQRVVIGEGVTSIGYGAFIRCVRLESITLPESVSTISALAFLDCESLCDVSISKSIMSIGVNAFHGCRNLTDMEFFTNAV